MTKITREDYMRKPQNKAKDISIIDKSDLTMMKNPTSFTPKENPDFDEAINYQSDNLHKNFRRNMELNYDQKMMMQRKLSEFKKAENESKKKQAQSARKSKVTYIKRKRKKAKRNTTRGKKSSKKKNKPQKQLTREEVFEFDPEEYM